MNHSETITIECTINGMPFQLHAAPGTPLSQLLREQGLLSVKQGRAAWANVVPVRCWSTAQQ
ncbi:hypothetical protein ACLK10_15825 [Escherichia coli]